MGQSQRRTKQDCMSTCYHNWMAHPLVKHLCKIRSNEFRLTSMDRRKTGQTYEGHPELDIFVVANQQGIGKCVIQQELTHLIQQAAEHQRCRGMKLSDLTTHYPATKSLDCELRRGLYEPRHFTITTFKSGQQWTAQPEVDVRLTTMDYASTTTQARWNPEAMHGII